MILIDTYLTYRATRTAIRGATKATRGIFELAMQCIGWAIAIAAFAIARVIGLVYFTMAFAINSTYARRQWNRLNRKK